MSTSAWERKGGLVERDECDGDLDESLFGVACLEEEQHQGT